MKNQNLIIQIFLAVAIVVLYILHFSPSRSNASQAESSDTLALQKPVGTIAFVNIDTLVQNLELWQSLRDKFQDKQNQYNTEITSKQRRLQTRANDLGDRVQKTLVTRSDAEKEAAQLEQENQTLMQLAENYRVQLAEEEQVSYRQILNEIMIYLEEVGKKEGYTYVLGNSFGGNILFAEQGLDITYEVLKGMNARFKSPQATK